MELAFPWPFSRGEWLAWSSAAITVLIGLALFLAPRTGLRLLGLRAAPERPAAVAEARATMAGFHLGLGLACILLAQPLLYLALGASWAFAAFGRLISILSDAGSTLYNWTQLVVALVLAGLPLAFALGLVM